MSAIASIMSRTSNISMRWSFILPAHWNNSLPLVKLLHSVTSSVFAFLLNAACSAESSLQIYTIYHLEASMWTIISLMWPLTNLLKTNAVIFYSQVHSFTWNKLWEFTFLCHFFFSLCLISIFHLYELQKQEEKWASDKFFFLFRGEY